jgi:uncharacterized protein (TIGR02246 family)
MTDTQHDTQRIVTLLGEYETFVNAGDAAAVTRLYTDAAVLLPGDMPTAVGLDDILGFYSGAFSQLGLTIRFEIDVTKIRILGDHAYATTSSTGTRAIKAAGNVVPEDNRELWVFERVDGDWRIARYMFNKTGPAA